MTDVVQIVRFFTLLSYGGLITCSVVLLAGLLERLLFGLFLSRRARTERSARGMFGTFRWVASVAPLFGILGTVAGIMVSFRGDGLEPDKLLSGIGVALWTTGFGLLAAILALTMRAMFLGVTERALFRVEERR